MDAEHSSDERRTHPPGLLTALSWSAGCLLAGGLGALSAGTGGTVAAWTAGAATGIACALPAVLIAGRRRRAGSHAERARATGSLEEQPRLDATRALLSEAVDRARALEAQLRQSQRMESLGRLSAGVAHDFNNLLTAMIGYAEVAMQKLGPAHDVAGDLEEIRRVAARAGELTRQLLAFSRKHATEPQRVEVDEIVLGIERLLRRVLGEHVELAVDARSAPARVEIDPGQLEQVLLNLAVNARDSMPDGGRLEISTGAIVLDARGGHDPEILPGEYVTIVVSDTGTGIAPDVLPKVFEPFYTTKPEGHGLGLGLAIVRSAVRGAGGHLRVESAVGRGTRFEILLPQCPAPGRDIPRPAEAGTAPRGSETVLLVEDEPAVRRIAAAELRSRGYRVVEAGDGIEALSLARSFAGEIHALFSDVVMPRMGGPELAERLRAERPSLKVLLCSGYVRELPPGPGADATSSFLAKPFHPAQLSRALRELLDGAGRAAAAAR